MYLDDVSLNLSGSTATAPAAPTGVTATAGNGSATVSWTAPANGGSPITSYTVTPYIGTTAQTPTTVTGNPPAASATVSGLTNGTAYTFTVTATNAAGTSPPSTASNAVTPVGQYGVYSGTEIPANPNASDPTQVEVGTQFSVNVPSQVVAIRFYKGSGNTGTHTGHLWSAAGVLLATVTFTGETASGWQTASLSTPVTLQAGATYTVSYWMTNGGYAYQGGQFASPQSTNVYVTGTAGVFRYGTNGSGIPTSTYNNTGYYVDALVTLQ
jgi:hypothetical protein